MYSKTPTGTAGRLRVQLDAPSSTISSSMRHFSAVKSFSYHSLEKIEKALLKAVANKLPEAIQRVRTRPALHVPPPIEKANREFAQQFNRSS